MKKSLLQILRCPISGASLFFEDEEYSGEDAKCGWLVTKDKKFRYQIKNGIPRFVPKTNYADNFGMQWNHFAKTQLDSHSGCNISSERFWHATSWSCEELNGKWVLDLGCGSGRFAEIALKCGANVVALDYSSAVDACYENLKLHSNLYVVQGDIYSLPFTHESFDFVYSLGVLQHTPDVKAAFFSLPSMVAPGGAICVDFYEKSIKSLLLPKYWLRPFTKRIPKTILFSALKKLVPIMLPISRLLSKVPIVGGQLKRIVPVANYEGIYPLSTQQIKEWALLDTFDWLSPTYDSPQTFDTAKRWINEAGLRRCEVVRAGHLVARGRR